MKLFKRSVYVNGNKQPNYIIIMILSIIVSVTWTSNFYEYQELRQEYNSAIVIYEYVHQNRMERSNPVQEQDSNVTEQDGEEVSMMPPTVEDKICNTFPKDCERMEAIAMAESRMNPSAINTANSDGSVDVGLLQVNSVHGHSQEYLLDVDNNLKVARVIYDTQGITAWAAFNNGSYKQFM